MKSKNGGGAWKRKTTPPSGMIDRMDMNRCGRTAKASGVKEMLCINAGCTKGACMEGAVWQQSSPCIPWEQFMESQHSIASSADISWANKSSAISREGKTEHCD